MAARRSAIRSATLSVIRLEDRCVPAALNYFTENSIQAHVGVAFDTTVTEFTDANGTSNASNITGTIDWGDGHTSAATLQLELPPGFHGPTPFYRVLGGHTYSAAGIYTIHISIHDPSGETLQLQNTATVSGATSALQGGAVAAVGANSNTATGQVVVAGFTDSDGNTNVGSFTGSIDWGDGQTSLAVFNGTTNAVGSPPYFQVQGNHTYAAAGTYTIDVTIHDSDGDSLLTANTAVVTPAPVLVSAGAPAIHSRTGVAANLFGAFNDFDTTATTSSLTGTINWGDGQTSQATFQHPDPIREPEFFNVNGSHTYSAAGTYEISITVQDSKGNSLEIDSSATVALLKSLFAVGSGPGSAPWVHVYNAQGTLVSSFLAYSSSFNGGVNVAVADVNGDGTLDIITGAGPGGGPHVEVFDGTKLGTVQADGTLPASAMLGSFYAYAPSFTGGVNVAAGDLNLDGRAEVITGAGPGGGPHVEVWGYTPGTSTAPLKLYAGFFAYEASFHGGVNVAAGDVNGDGFADIITGAGPGGGPHVKAFDWTVLAAGGTTEANAIAHPLQSFFAFDPTFTGGVSVAVGDVNGDFTDDIIAGAGPGGGPHVKAFDGSNLSVLANFFADPPSFTGGVRVASVQAMGSTTGDIVTGPGMGSGPIIDVFSANGTEEASFAAFDPSFLGGVFVG